ncbi:MAG: response regulator transcription factor [Chitinophagaceae bacterium]|nr:MAG: response regulator transcription factor [Chitinophagaceae bacterium]
MRNTIGNIRIVMADDHEIFRDGFRLMISRQEDIQLVGEAGDGKELVELVATLKPDVVVTDIKMPRMDGIEAAKTILQNHPDIGVIGLSMFDEEDLIIDMLEAGAKGYLLKNADKHEVAEAIRTVYQEEPYYCKHTSARLAQMIAKSKFNPYKKNKKIEFSEREIEIIRLICQELTNKEIADQLFLSIRTVEGYRLKIQEKMNVKNSIGLVIYAIRNNLYKPA